MVWGWKMPVHIFLSSWANFPVNMATKTSVPNGQMLGTKCRVQMLVILAAVLRNSKECPAGSELEMPILHMLGRGLQDHSKKWSENTWFRCLGFWTYAPFKAKVLTTTPSMMRIQPKQCLQKNMRGGHGQESRSRPLANFISTDFKHHHHHQQQHHHHHHPRHRHHHHHHHQP